MLYRKKKRYGKTKVTNIVVVWLFAIAGMAALVVAQDTPADESVVLLAEADPLAAASVEGTTDYGTARELLASRQPVAASGAADGVLLPRRWRALGTGTPRGRRLTELQI